MMRLWRHHRFVTGDYEQMLRWMKAGADLGEPASLLNLGLLHESEGDKQAAAKAFRAAAERGDRYGWLGLARLAETSAERKDLLLTWLMAYEELSIVDPLDQMSGVLVEALQDLLTREQVYAGPRDGVVNDDLRAAVKDARALAAKRYPGPGRPAAFAGGAMSVLPLGGKVKLGDAEGMVLYTFAGDRPGVSSCMARCLGELWTPFAVAEGAVAAEPFSIVRRTDGTRVWALDGMPLYRFRREGGLLTTDGAGEMWHPVLR